MNHHIFVLIAVAVDIISKFVVDLSIEFILDGKDEATWDNISIDGKLFGKNNCEGTSNKIICFLLFFPLYIFSMSSRIATVNYFGHKHFFLTFSCLSVCEVVSDLYYK